MKWSYSKLSTYLECPRRFELKYILAIKKQVVSDALAIGVGIHGFLEYLGNNQLATLDDCRGAYRASIEYDKLATKSAVESNLKLVDLYYKSGKWITPWVLPSGKPATEVDFDFEDDGVALRGTIDIIADGSRAIVDYKTSKNLYTQRQANDSDQLTLYSWVAAALFNIVPGHVGYQVIIKDGSGVQNVYSMRNTHQIKELKEKIKKIEIAVKSTKTFKKIIGKQCNWCDYREECANNYGKQIGLWTEEG